MHLCYLKRRSTMLLTCLVIVVIFCLFQVYQLKVKLSLQANNSNKKKILKTSGNKIAHRLAFVQRKCQNMGDTSKLQFDSLSYTNLTYPWIYVSHKYKFLYCQTPKVGTTNWMKIIATLEENKQGKIGDTSDVHSAGLLRLSSLTESERARVMKDYKKFMVVREPFERAVSAYRDKFIPHFGFNKSVLQTTGNEIIKYYRNYDTDEHLFSKNKPLDNNVPTFEEFIQYVVDKHSKVTPLFYWEPRHWIPLSDLCYPCNINYDFILDIAHIAEESDFLLTSLGVPQDIRYPSWTDSLTKEKSGNLNKLHERTVNYFRNINSKYTRYVSELYRYYRKDYELFGFEILPQLQPLVAPF